MFKFFIVICLLVLVINSCSGMDINIITANVPLMSKGYIFINVNGWHDVYTVPFNIPVHYWSW